MKLKKYSLVFLVTVFLSAFATTAFGDSAHYYPKGYTSASNLVYYKDSSVGSYGYGGYVDTGATSWNNISSKVNLSSTTSEPDNFIIATYVEQTISGMSVYGIADYWYKGIFGWRQVDPEDTRHRTRIRFDYTHLSTLQYGQKVDIFIHEFGHALSLKHNDDSGVNSVMRFVELTSAGVQTVDKDHIKQKWGN